MKRIPVFLSAAFLAASFASADSLSLSFSQNWVENLFQTRYAEADAVTAAGISWEKALSEFSLLAGVEYYALHENTGLSLASLSVGADYLHAVNEKTALFFSLMGDASLFRTEFSDFNHTDVRFMAALKTYLSPSSILKATATSEYRSYRYDPFDYFSQGLAVSIDKYFPTRTTLQAELGWGYKYFFHPQTVVAPVAIEPAAIGVQVGHLPDLGMEAHGKRSVKELQAQGIHSLELDILDGLLVNPELGNIVGARQGISPLIDKVKKDLKMPTIP